ncbi:MAG: hypothetical protein J2P17_06940 [Mycobacterium sp.]|nr:hypothetical protein [Mycobacterium sp.]
MSGNDFKANVSAIEKFAKVLLPAPTNGLLSNASHQAQMYSLNNVLYNITGLPNTGTGDRLSGFGLLWSDALKVLEELYADLAMNYQHLWQATEASGSELMGVVRYYRESDLAALRQLDLHYGDGTKLPPLHPGVRRAAQAGSDLDTKPVVDPVDVLKPPKEDASRSPDKYVYLSPAYWIGYAAELIIGQNPWEEAGKFVAGDWKSLDKTADAIKNLADFNTAYANAQDKITAQIFPDYWQGKAAHGAKIYFNRLSETIRAQVQVLQGLSGDVKKLADAMYKVAQDVKTILDTITDIIITVGISAAVKAITETPAVVQKVLEWWGKYIKVGEVASVSVGTVLDIIKERKKELNGLQLSISASGYDYPGIEPVRGSSTSSTPPASSPGPSTKVSKIATGGSAAAVSPTVWDMEWT